MTASEQQLNLKQRAKVFAALSDPNRLRIVELLYGHGEMSGSQLADALGISLALYSHHSKALVEAGVIKRRKLGQTRYCSLDRELLGVVVAGFPGNTEEES